MPDLIPFVTYSDGPRLPTGLARITRDLTSRLFAEQASLGIEVLQVGYDPIPGLAPPWPVWAMGHLDTEGDWGASVINDAVWQYFGPNRGGVLFTVWDPARAFPLLEVKQIEQRWGYFPIDAVNVNDSIGGPAGEAVRRYDRVLGYGRWGSQVLRTCRDDGVPYLPHGLDLETWDYHLTQEQLGRASEILNPKPHEIVIGCVATNQTRKDLALYFATLRILRDRGLKVKGWLHTDRMERAWSVTQLVMDFQLQKKVVVTLGGTLDDAELAACYACCGATIAPGLGEGFGYPIVESLACGTPVVHGDYAGGAELVPLNAWRFPMRAERMEGLYGLRRPVFNPEDVANALQRALDWRRNDHQVCQAYCRASVQHLAWDNLWPRWKQWFRKGLEEYRDA